jgi:phosphomannomutase
VSIFKAYDIRGIVPSELDADAAQRIGRATVRFLGARRLAIGRDARTHSPELGEALVRGAREAGASVLDIGLAATPMLYYAVDALGADGGIMLTASHNPAQYNGMKICGANALPIGEATGLREIERLAASSGGERAAPRGGRESVDIVEGYVRHAMGVASGQAPALHVAIDCANGMAAVGLEPLLARLPLRVERLYFEPDGRFPNHPADPLALQNLRDVSAAVKRSGADFGVAFDGDADRAVFVDEHGAPIPSDLMTALLARSQLARAPGGTVLYDLRSSWATAEEIRAAGGVPVMCRVGHSFVKAQMRESGAIFAGELSGHFYFRFSERLVADDGIAAFVALLDVLGRARQPLSQLIAPLRRYAASGEINRHVDDPRALIEAVAREHPNAREASRLDGLLVRYDDWWFNLRPSNTEPLLRLNVEARSAPRMVEERDRLLARIGGTA